LKEITVYSFARSCRLAIVILAVLYGPSLFAQSNEWRVMPIRSEEEFNLGWIGGEAEQHPHGIARCLYHPNVIYLSHDVGGPWRSGNAGRTWRKTLATGLYLRYGQSIEVDPADPDTIFIIVDNSWNWLASNAEGIYRSRDGGETFEQVLNAEPNYDSSIHRIYRHNIAYDLASVTSSNATRWYAAFPENGLYRSDDGGDTWSGVLSSLNGHETVYAIQTHPTDGQTVYVASSSGLYASSSRGTSLSPLGDLPSGAVSSVAIHPGTPDTIYATGRTNGLYRSLNGGTNFTLLRSFDAGRVFLNPGYPEVIYLTGINANTIISHDGGQTWITNMTTVPVPGLNRDGSWKSIIAGKQTGIVPNPDDPDEAVAFSRATLWKTTDGGQTFVDASTLFTGYSASASQSTMAFDRFNPERFAFFNNDVGMTITTNQSDFFGRRNDQAWGWKNEGYISWVGTYAGDIQPIEGSQVIVASIGYYFDTELMRTMDAGHTWELVTSNEHRNFFISFHPDDPNVVYAGDKISHNAGQTFSYVDFGSFSNLSPEIVGLCRVQGDTIYAMDVPRREYLLRSDDRGTNWYEYAHPGWRFRLLNSFAAFAVDPVQPNKVYTLDSSHDLAIFDGTNWVGSGVLALSGGVLIDNFIRTIAVDPNHPEVIYAGTNADGLPCIFRSMNGGGTWEDITYNLPRTGMDAMQVNPHIGELFRGSLVGTWVFPPPPGLTYSSTNLVHDKLLTYAEVETPPTLEIVPAPGNQIAISWSPDVPIWLLKQAPDLVSPAWSNSPSGSTNPVTLPVTDEKTYYRLCL